MFFEKNLGNVENHSSQLLLLLQPIKHDLFPPESHDLKYFIQMIFMQFQAG